MESSHVLPFIILCLGGGKYKHRKVRQGEEELSKEDEQDADKDGCDAPVMDHDCEAPGMPVRDNETVKSINLLLYILSSACSSFLNK